MKKCSKHRSIQNTDKNQTAAIFISKKMHGNIYDKKT